MGAYRVSKSALIAFSVVLAQQLKDKQIDVNACCPGYCNTDMTKHMGRLSPEEGAKTPVLLALGDDLGSGNFWFEEKITPW
uniref:Carbonyl reductase n=2 Tax=Panagrolaimus sp. JU765 TaxID=591449 RepID=A0AC34QUX9_9BILA